MVIIITTDWYVANASRAPYVLRKYTNISVKTNPVIEDSKLIKINLLYIFLPFITDNNSVLIAYNKIVKAVT
jgi:hypothetical protein